MIKRGRKGEAEASSPVVIAGGFDNRPDPPDTLTKAQAEIWRAVVASEHWDFFKTAATRFLLADYCCHRETAESLTQTVNQFEGECLTSDEKSARHYQILLCMRAKETNAALTLATKLRLTNQSRYSEKSAETAARRAGNIPQKAAVGNKPWA